MRIVSVNVGLPRSVEWGGHTITTSIFKQPVVGPVPLNGHQLAGDQQADLTVHGGPDKAVYAYDTVHYTHWQQQMVRADWAPGLFGENLTTEGLLETTVRVGDVFGIGTARLRAVQPRLPCYKLNVRFDDPGMAARFARAGRSGIYFRVVEPGIVRAHDAIELLEAAATTITIADLAHVLLSRQADPDTLAAVLALPHLPRSLKRQLGVQ